MYTSKGAILLYRLMSGTCVRRQPGPQGAKGWARVVTRDLCLWPLIRSCLSYWKSLRTMEALESKTPAHISITLPGHPCSSLPWLKAGRPGLSHYHQGAWPSPGVSQAMCSVGETFFADHDRFKYETNTCWYCRKLTVLFVLPPPPLPLTGPL